MIVNTYFKRYRDSTINVLAALAVTALLSLNTCLALEPGAMASEVPLASLGIKDASTFDGQLIYIDFWASWCAPCRISLPWLKELQNKYSDKGLKVIAINLDKDSAKAEEILNELEPKFTSILNPKGNIAKLFELKSMPSSYIIDRSGKVIFEHRGFRESDKESIESKLAELLS